MTKSAQPRPRSTGSPIQVSRYRNPDATDRKHTRSDYLRILAIERSVLAWQQVTLVLIAASAVTAHMPMRGGHAIAIGLALIAAFTAGASLHRWRRR